VGNVEGLLEETTERRYDIDFILAVDIVVWLKSLLQQSRSGGFHHLALFIARQVITRDTTRTVRNFNTYSDINIT
jgi:hypothetical protein